MALPTIPGALFDVQGLTKLYDPRPAIQDVTFSVPRGQVVGFLGPIGAGKSTTMRILTGYVEASAGTASVGGFDVFDHSLEVRRRVGYLPETMPLYKEMRVREFLEMLCKLRGVAPSRRGACLDHALQACVLGDHRSQVIGRLSRGQRRRVGLAQAIVHDPEGVILDEPTAGLDPAETRETRDLIKTLGRQHTVIVSSHSLPEVAATCGRVLVIDKGRMVADDTPERLADGLAGARGHEVKMLVRGSPIAIEVRMRAVEGVDDVTVGNVGDGLWSVVVTTSRADGGEELARAAVEAGFGLLELQTRPPGLEEVFLRLTTVEAQ